MEYLEFSENVVKFWLTYDETKHSYRAQLQINIKYFERKWNL